MKHRVGRIFEDIAVLCLGILLLLATAFSAGFRYTTHVKSTANQTTAESSQIENGLSTNPGSKQKKVKSKPSNVQKQKPDTDNATNNQAPAIDSSASASSAYPLTITQPDNTAPADPTVVDPTGTTPTTLPNPVLEVPPITPVDPTKPTPCGVCGASSLNVSTNNILCPMASPTTVSTMVCITTNN